MNLFIYVYACLLVFSISSFNLYKTDRSKTSLEYDCLDYYVSDGIVTYIPMESLAHQLIAYCIRPSTENESWEIPKMIDMQNLTFDMLNNDSITGEQLLAWSASIELVERYKAFILGKSENDRFEVYYNCTSPWFGKHCQYHFWETTMIEEVNAIFLLKDYESPKDSTCYTLLPVSLSLHRLISNVELES